MGMEMAMSNDRRSLSSIADFFENRSVFVTGGTGFLGKLLIEKLLRSCPGIKHIYVLVRPKRRQDSDQRLRELLQSQAFDRLRNVDPQALSKIIAIKGNLVEAGLGLSDEDEATLTREVSVVFHSAATVNFEEPLKNSVAMNLHGTMAIIQLCWKLSNIAAFVHLSTAYSNCERSETYERIYPTAQDPEKVLGAASWLSSAVMDEIYQATKGNKPNTYIYTKALAEALVETRAAGLPTAIVRPSIVGPTAAEPYPGWIDSPNGPIGLFLASGNGLLHTVFCDKSKRADMVPADYVINLMIAAAWHTASTAEETGPKEITIYNFGSGIDNPLTWGDALAISMETSQTKYPFETAILYPNLTPTISHFSHRVNTLVFQIIPSFLLDAAARWTGRPPRLMKIQRKLMRTQGALAYFCTREWDFRSKNVPLLNDALPDVDRKTFNFDIKGIVWREYLETGILGCRTYFLGQNPASIPECVDKLVRKKRFEFVAKAMSSFLMFCFVARLLSTPLRRRPFSQQRANLALTAMKKF